MTERESSYQAGRFETRSFTRNAFNGDLRVQSACETYGDAEQRSLKSEEAWQLDAQLPPGIEQKLGKTGKEQVLSAIQARKHQVEKDVTVAQEQVITQQKIKTEVNGLLAQAPESLLAGSLAALAVWVINRLPNKVYKTTAIATVLSLALAACSTVNKTPNPEIPTQPGVVAGETINPNPSTEETPVLPTATEVATTEPEPLFDAYGALTTYLESGIIDTSEMSTEQFAEFSKALAEKRNADRGISVVVFDNGNDDPAYIDNNLDMRPYDGTPDQSEVIEMFLPVAGRDSAGNLQVEQDGKIITISNSADVDWNAVITSSSDTSINWPTGRWGDEIKYQVDNGQPGYVGNLLVFKPTILLDQTVHNFYLERRGMVPGLKLLTVEETDSNGVPVLFRMSLAIAGPSFDLVDEGANINELGDLDSIGGKSGRFFDNLQINNVYFSGFYSYLDVVYSYNLGNVSIDNYSGIVTVNNLLPVLTNQEKNRQDFMIIPVTFFIKKK